MHGTEAAASLAYYSLFSLFPLTLFMVAILGYVMESEAAFQQTLQLMRLLFPFSGDLITRNLADVIATRSTVTVLGLLGLLWSATGFFNVLAININRAWPSVKLRGAVTSRLFSLGMIGVLFVLLLLSLFSTTLISLLPYTIHLFGGPDGLDFSAWRALLPFLPPLFTYLMFVALYRWVPNKTVQWKAVLIGAFFTALVWELSKSLFAFYLRSGMSRYEFIYGSLAALIALMFWTYFSNLFALLGAHLVAAIDQRVEQKQAAPQAKTGVERELQKGIHG